MMGHNTYSILLVIIILKVRFVMYVTSWKEHSVVNHQLPTVPAQFPFKIITDLKVIFNYIFF